MAKATNNSSSQLEKKVKERETKVNAIIEKGFTLAEKYGERTKHEVHSAHSTSEYQFNHKGFDIITSSGHNMFGGNDIKIQYEKNVVFDAYFQAQSDVPEVRSYAQGDWENKFNELYANRKSIKNEQVRQAALSTAQYLKKQQESRKIENLEKKAKKLGL